jgi:CheY-like chemotaxis protein
MRMDRAAGRTVLVVDDEPDVQRYLATLLEDAGFTVLTAADGERALELVRAHRPDLISLDLIMPKKSGHKLLYELRKDRALARIPVLVVTAHARDELGRSRLQDLLDNGVLSGPGTYLEKPVNPLTYIRSIQRALGIDEGEAVEERLHLKDELQKSLQGASADVLRRALDAIKDRRD